MKTIQMITSPFPLVLTFGAIIALALTGNLFAASPILVTVQAAAVALNLWARISFQKGTFRVTAAPGGARIITCGPYRIIRHPMYSAVLVLIWVGVASHLSYLPWRPQSPLQQWSSCESPRKNNCFAQDILNTWTMPDPPGH